MKKPILIVALIFFFVSAACSAPVRTKWSPTPTTSAPADAPQVTPTVSDQPAATAEDLGDVPVEPTSENTQRAMPEGVVNLMVLGSDFREGAGHRTDVIMLVSVNTVNQTVSVVSFPRDLYVPIPGWTTQRINTAEPHGGFDTLAATMESNFGVRPTYYVMTDFQGFKNVINSLGGIDVYIGSRLVDQCDLPMANGEGTCTVDPGLMRMDGDTALWYVRSRHTSSDLDRLRREQEVMMGLFVGVMSGGLQNLPGLFAQYQASVRTNLTVDAITPLLPTAARVFSDRKLIQRYTMTVKEAKPFVTSTGAQVLLPDYDAINAILDQAIFNQ